MGRGGVGSIKEEVRSMSRFRVRIVKTWQTTQTILQEGFVYVDADDPEEAAEIVSCDEYGDEDVEWGKEEVIEADESYDDDPQNIDLSRDVVKISDALTN
jgi:hypothetical protein